MEPVLLGVIGKLTALMIVFDVFAGKLPERPVPHLVVFDVVAAPSELPFKAGMLLDESSICPADPFHVASLKPYMPAALANVVCGYQ